MRRPAGVILTPPSIGPKVLYRVLEDQSLDSPQISIRHESHGIVVCRSLVVVHHVGHGKTELEVVAKTSNRRHDYVGFVSPRQETHGSQCLRLQPKKCHGSSAILNMVIRDKGHRPPTPEDLTHAGRGVLYGHHLAPALATNTPTV